MKAPLRGSSPPSPLTGSVSCLQQRKKMEDILASVQRKYENKVADLQTTVDKLLKVSFPTQPSLNRSSPYTLKYTLCFLMSQKRTHKLVFKIPASADRQTDSIVNLICPVNQTVTYQNYSVGNKSYLYRTFLS